MQVFPKIDIEPCEDFFGCNNNAALAYPYGCNESPRALPQTYGSVNHQFYTQLSGLSANQRTDYDSNRRQLVGRKLSGVPLAAMFR